MSRPRPQSTRGSAVTFVSSRRRAGGTCSPSAPPRWHSQSARPACLSPRRRSPTSGTHAGAPHNGVEPPPRDRCRRCWGMRRQIREVPRMSSPGAQRHTPPTENPPLAETETPPLGETPPLVKRAGVRMRAPWRRRAMASGRTRSGRASPSWRRRRRAHREQGDLSSHRSPCDKHAPRAIRNRVRMKREMNSSPIWGQFE